jgi:hypothetical protein
LGQPKKSLREIPAEKFFEALSAGNEEIERGSSQALLLEIIACPQFENGADSSKAMPTSVPTIFCQVNRHRPCPISGKPDWSYPSNERILIISLRLAASIVRWMESEWTLKTTYIAAWDREVKGIDAAALHNLPITSISVKRWFNQLGSEFQRKLAAVLNREQK